MRKNKLEKIKENYMKENELIAPDLWPNVIPLKKSLIYFLPIDLGITYLFPVDQDNTVGYTDGNTLYIAQFNGDEVKYKKITDKYVGSKDPVKYCFTPIFDKEWIAFSVTRGVNLVNLKTKKNLFSVPVTDFYSEITHIYPIPNKSFTFLIEYEIVEHPFDRRLLSIVQFDENEECYIKESKMQENRNCFDYSTLSFRDNIYFGFNPSSSVFEAFDSNTLKPAQHPLLKVLQSFPQRDISLESIIYLLIHPSLPVAIVMDISDIGDIDILCRWWLINWEEPDYKKQITEIPLLSYTIFNRGIKAVIEDLQFSPDGKWLVYVDYCDKPGSYVAVPVDFSQENYFGKPLYLGGPYSEERFCSYTWIKKPLSFVATNGENIYKWDFSQLKRKFESK